MTALGDNLGSIKRMKLKRAFWWPAAWFVVLSGLLLVAGCLGVTSPTSGDEASLTSNEESSPTSSEDAVRAIEAPFLPGIKDSYEPDSEAQPAVMVLGDTVVERRLDVGDVDWLATRGDLQEGDLVRLAWTVEGKSAAVQIDYVLESGEIVGTAGGQAMAGDLNLVTVQDWPLLPPGTALIRLSNAGPGSAVYRAVVMRE